MNELHLLIDDLRCVGEDIAARTPEWGKKFLETLPVTHLYIDHDLGDCETGYEVVVWALENGYMPEFVQIVTDNPVGRKNIENALFNNGYTRDGRYWNKNPL